MAVPWDAGMGGAAASRFIPLPIGRPGPRINVGKAISNVGSAIKVAANRPGNVKGVQQFLRQMGYNIAVDGAYGPQTMGALVDWHSGAQNRNPNKWNAKNVRVEDPQRTNSPRNAQNHPIVVRQGKPQKPSAVTSNAANRTTKKVVSSKDGRTILGAGPVSNSPLDLPSLDPDTYVDSLMKLKYGPILSELDRRRAQIESAGTNRVSEIQDMYGTYVNDMVERGGKANAERAELAAATQGLAGAIAGAIPMGEASASELAVRGDIESDYAGLINQSAADFDRRSADAARAGGVFAASQARSATADSLSDLDAQKTDVLSQRGADVGSTRNELMQWQWEQGLRQRELEAGIQSDTLKNQLSMLELQAAMRMAPLESKKAQAELDRLMADITYTQAQTRKTEAETGQVGLADDESFPSNFKGLNQVDRDNLAASIAKRIPQGASVAQVTRIVKSALRTIGYNPNNPAVARFGFNLARAYDTKATGKTSPNWWGFGK